MENFTVGSGDAIPIDDDEAALSQSDVACCEAAIAQIEPPDIIKPKKLANTGFSGLFLQD